jgi:hypothetical protein
MRMDALPGSLIALYALSLQGVIARRDEPKQCVGISLCIPSARYFGWLFVV